MIILSPGTDDDDEDNDDGGDDNDESFESCVIIQNKNTFSLY